jgi:HAD superfamily hydrolase (TIGR01509 family)
MVKAVVFDLGNVLVDFDYRIAARRLAAHSAISAEQLMMFLARSPGLVDYEKGRVSRQQFFDEFRAGTGFAGDLAEFAVSFSDIFTEIEPMVQLHAALRERGVATYVFSNTNDLATDHIRRTFPFYSHFDGYILSYEHGVLKPDARLYEALECQSGLSGGEILYLDDRLENIAAGAARGWQVILHESPEKSRAAIRDLGLLP